MIQVEKVKINDIPCLVVVDSETANKPLPVITYFHGFTSAKEHDLPIAFLLAEEGYRVILPDSILHGEREGKTTFLKKQLAFWDIVIQNVADLQTIHEYVQDERLISDDLFGVAGTSMGGITTSASLVKYPWIHTAAVLMGSPKLSDFARMMIEEYEKTDNPALPEEKVKTLFSNLDTIDLAKHMDHLAERPLLFWHGDKDPVVPFDHSYTFYQSARDMYKNKKQLHFIKEVGRDHKVSRFAILETVKWFKKHLG
ncbi:MAG TPA: prolyl oligopeptidase family serine peptidase [Cerasibacillus sp.]|uniref:prolyl oligopeptidase family serine peptidase n=1 Tax=Cerasibacillus sp. TaxID=2498711 RepID=UPI002F40D7C3